MTMGERIRALSAPVDHGSVFLRDSESRETHGNWNPESSPVSFSDDSVLFSVQPSVDGEVEFEIWRGEPKGPLAKVLYNGSILLAHGRIVMHDANDDFRIEIPGLGHGGPVSILVDDEDFPKKVQVVLLF
jgi:hypothetical protein